MAASASDSHPFPIYNARFRMVFPILDNDGDLVTAAAGLDSEGSQDQGTYADLTNEATEIATSSGTYYLDLIATELDNMSLAVIVKTSTTDAKTTVFTLNPKRLPILRTGTAQAGGASSITLDASASAIDDYYVGCYVNITNNSPANALGQARKITAYNGSTKVATVQGTYGTNPSSASTFEILATEEWSWRFADLKSIDGLATNGNNATLSLKQLNIVNSAGNAIVASATGSNGHGIAASGHGTGEGISGTGGATGHGIEGIGGATSGAGIRGLGVAGNSTGIDAVGQGSAAGLTGTGGATGHGGLFTGGATSGDGLRAVAAADGHGFTTTGVGTTKHGVNATGGSTTSHGISATGGGVGHGILATSGGGATGDGFRAVAASTNGNGFNGLGVGTGQGALFTGGATGNGMRLVGGATSGHGLYVTTTAGDGFNLAPTTGHGISLAANGTDKHGLFVTGGTGGASDGIKAVAGTGGTGFRTDIIGILTGNITGNLSGTVGSVVNQTLRTGTAQSGAASTITLDASASALDDFYKHALIVTTGGTGTGQARTVSGYVGSTKVASVTPNWTTTPDSTTTFAIIAAGSIAGATAPTAGEVADAVWDEARAGHVAAGSFGEYTPANVTHFKGTASAGTAGYAGIDWSAINAPTTTVNLSGTTIKDATDVNTDTDALLARLTSARAGYLDNLNIGGLVASSAEATAIQNNTRVVRVVPDVIERPDSGTTTYRIELFLYDEVGNMEAPDSAPTIALVNQDGTDRSSRLDSTTMALVSTGRYRAIYTASVGDALEQLVWAFTVVEGGATRLYGNASLIVDTSAVDFTAADRTKLEAIHTKLPSKSFLTGTANSDGDVQLNEATGNYHEDWVYLDPTNGAAGTTVNTNGILFNPSSTFADASAIAVSRGRKNIKFAPGSNVYLASGTYDGYRVDVHGGSFTVNQAVTFSSARIFSSLPGGAFDPDIGSGLTTVDLDTAVFYENLIISFNARATNYCYLKDCVIGNLSGAVTFTINGDNGTDPVYLQDCYTSKISDLTFSCGGGADLILNGWYGDFTITNLAAGTTVIVYGYAKVTIAASCTGGTVRHTSHVEVTNNSSGGATAVDLVSDGTATDAIYNIVNSGSHGNAAIKADTAAIKAKTDNLPATPAATGDAMTLTAGERNAIADAHLDRTDGVETDWTVRQAHRMGLAADAGITTGMNTSVGVVKNPSGSKNRVIATIDGLGNRTPSAFDKS